MQKKFKQMTLPFIYNDIENAINNQKPEFLDCLDNCIDFNKLIPAEFKYVYYKREGRRHKYRLESFIRAFIVKAFLGVSTVATFIAVLKCSAELRDFCGFDTVPNAATFSRFSKDYCVCIEMMFNSLVEQTEQLKKLIKGKKKTVSVKTLVISIVLTAIFAPAILLAIFIFM